MLPGNIIVFRDGVGDGDMHTVRDFEVDQFMRTFSSFGDTYKPKFAEIVVQKRINTRMFLRRVSLHSVALCQCDSFSTRPTCPDYYDLRRMSNISGKFVSFMLAMRMGMEFC